MEKIDPEQIDKELLPLMSPESRVDVRSIAMQYFLGLTGTKEGSDFLSQNAKRLGAIVQLVQVKFPTFLPPPKTVSIELECTYFMQHLDASLAPNLSIKFHWPC